MQLIDGLGNEHELYLHADDDLLVGLHVPVAWTRFGELAYTTSLVWPLLPPPPYDERGRTILGQFLSMESTPMMAFELGLTLVPVSIWWRQGSPGIDTIRNVMFDIRDR